MNHLLLKLYINCKTLMICEDGQDLVEYSLIFSLIALGAVSGMSFLASGLNNAFSSIDSTLTTNV
jgi:pilus assembly protein Flp/PilA